MTTRRFLTALLLAASVTTLSCGGGSGGGEEVPPPPTSDGFPTLPPAGTALAIVSDQGDPVGRGRAYSYTQASAGFEVTMAGENLRILLRGDEQWWGTVTPVSGATTLRVGDYAGLPQTPEPASNNAWQSWGLDAVIPERCPFSTGRFRITEVEYLDGTLVRLAADFEQRCEGAAGGLRGRLRWDARDTTAAPGPTAEPAGLWRPPAGSVPASGNVLHVEGSYGLPNVPGPALQYTPLDAGFSLRAGGPVVNFKIKGDVHWGGSFGTMSSIDRIRVGHYAGLKSLNPNPTRGGFGFSRSPSEECGNHTPAWVQVDEAAYDGERLTKLVMRFERRCGKEAASPALRGYVRWSADDRRGPAGPTLSVPAGLWRADPATVPASGSWVRFESEPGDWLGGGESTTLTPQATPFELYESGNAIHFAFGPPETRWWGRFQAVSGVGRVEPGYYGALVGAIPGNPARGGLQVYAPGRACEPAGWYAIDQVSYSHRALRTLDLRFELRCDGNTPALRGQIHWVSDDPVVMAGPVDGSLPLPPPPAHDLQPPASGSYVLFESGPDDLFGLGQTWLYTSANAGIDVQTHLGPLLVTIRGDQRWSGLFMPPPDVPLSAPLSYETARDVPAEPDVAQMVFSGLTPCDGLKAPSSWRIDRLVVDGGGQARALDMSFVAQCATEFTPLRGRIHWEADDPTLPGPVLPPPADLWQLPAALVPATGNYFHLHSAMGAWVGEGRNHLLTEANSGVRWREIDQGVEGQWEAPDEGPYRVQFVGIRGQGGLQPGYYGGLSLTPGPHNPARGAMMINSPGRGCYGTSDWYVIDDIAYDGEGLARLAARFGLRCDGVGPPVHGQIRWAR
jgi:hypothetical protein